MMATEVKVPTLGESITEATLGQWLKQPGDAVKQDEPIASLETDKVAVEVNAPSAGTMGEQLVKEGDTVDVGAVIARIEAGGAAAAAAPAPAARPVGNAGQSGRPGRDAGAAVRSDRAACRRRRPHPVAGGAPGRAGASSRSVAGSRAPARTAA